MANGSFEPRPVSSRLMRGIGAALLLTLPACSSFQANPKLASKPSLKLVSVCAQAQPTVKAGMMAAFQSMGSRYGQDVLPMLRDQAAAWAKNQLAASDAIPNEATTNTNSTSTSPPSTSQYSCVSSGEVPSQQALAQRAAELGVDAVIAVNHSWSVQSQEQVRMSDVAVADGLEARVILSVLIVSKSSEVWLDAKQHSDSKVGFSGEQLLGGVGEEQIHRVLKSSAAVAWSELAEKLKQVR